ncbi:MAG: DUF2236 domain-containing protein [Taibaiella sp.]|nr:DUF2236 domain-containing protein [Taibaiella sp.]
MNSQQFVAENSIIRLIWGNSDVVLFIFAGAAADFALNKAVDWLYFSGKLPADPLGRLFSTVSYAHKIIFASEENAHAAIDAITAIHSAVEHKRKASIPDWAYRDVLYMLIQYSINAWELLERQLSPQEKEEIYNVFYRMGTRMDIGGLPLSFTLWEADRLKHMHNDLAVSKYTPDLFAQYRKHLGGLRYRIMLRAQALLLPEYPKKLLVLRSSGAFSAMLYLYKYSRLNRLTKKLRELMLPVAYRSQILALDVAPV